MTRLRECRINAKLSQKHVAITLGVAAPSVANWESGKTNPTHENIIKLADLYGVTVDYLLGRTDEPTNDVQTAENATLSEMRYALDKKTKDFTDNEIADLIDLANIIVARRNRQKE